MTSERKKLYLYTGINLIIGVIVGIVLFYGQLKSVPEFFETEYTYSTKADFIDVARVWWMNLIWMFSVLLAHSVFSMAYIHIIVSVRGCVSAFSVMYMLKFLGIREAVASILPQCLSIIPLLCWFSVSIIEKRKMQTPEERNNFYLKRTQTLLMFLFSLLAAVIEALLFKLFCSNLF